MTEQTQEQVEREGQYNLPKLIEAVSPGHINDKDALESKFYGCLVSERGYRDNSLLQSLGSLETNVDAIKEKQRIMKAIIARPDLAKEVVSLDYEPFPESHVGLKDYLEHGPRFYEQAKKAVEVLRQVNTQSSSKLDASAMGLERILELGEGETQLVKEIGEEARHSQRLFGSFNLQYLVGRREANINQEDGYGFRLFPMNNGEEKSINGVPVTVKRDLIRHMRSKLCESLTDDFSAISMNVLYSYSENGLDATFSFDEGQSDLSKEGSNRMEKVGIEAECLVRKGYEPTKSDITGFGKRISNWREKVTEEAKESKFKKYARKVAITSAFSEASNLVARLSGRIESENTDSEFLCKSLRQIVEKRKVELAQYKGARSSFGNLQRELKDYLNVAEFFITKNKSGYPLCFPEILESEARTISIQNLYPARIVVNGEQKAIPSDVCLNGKPNVITGQNAGGKSIYIVSANDAIVMAQAGLPIFADSAELSIKDALFLHFIKNGDAKIGQSTFENSLRRFKEILSDIPKYKNPHITIDELAAGTDPQSAFDVSQRLVKTMVNLGSRASSNIVTQFTDVAEMARERYHVNPLMVDGNYHVVPGIGKARGLDLANKIGLTEEFCSDILEQSKD